ncbi:hypothetical protein GCM10011338_21120 [Alteromonas lipolytica]|nr:hypothetical protein GCM10011338_21120 [Alteromonas lipolytica]
MLFYTHEIMQGGPGLRRAKPGWREIISDSYLFRHTENTTSFRSELVDLSGDV